MEGLDLKDDIDGTAALCAALDLVLSAPTAAAHTAASVGAEVWFLTAGRGWPQLGTDEYPWYANTRVYLAGKIRRLGCGDAALRRRPGGVRRPPDMSHCALCRSGDRDVVQTQSLALLNRDQPCNIDFGVCKACGHLQQWPPVPPALMAHHYESIAAYELFGDPQSLRAAPPARHARRLPVAGVGHRTCARQRL